MIPHHTQDQGSGQEEHERPGGPNLITLVDLLTVLGPALDELDPVIGLFSRELESALIDHLYDIR